MKFLKSIFKRKRRTEVESFLKMKKRDRLSPTDTPYIVENGCVYLNREPEILSKDFVSSGSSTSKKKYRI